VLSLRDRILILFATAPDGFSITPKELKAKFVDSKTNAIHSVLWRLTQKKVLGRKGFSHYVIGPALIDELGGSDV
jgi:hypothetical protein